MTKQSWLDSWQDQETYIFSQASRWTRGPIKAPIKWGKAAEAWMSELYLYSIQLQDVHRETICNFHDTLSLKRREHHR